MIVQHVVGNFGLHLHHLHLKVSVNDEVLLTLTKSLLIRTGLSMGMRSAARDIVEMFAHVRFNDCCQGSHMNLLNFF